MSDSVGDVPVLELVHLRVDPDSIQQFTDCASRAMVHLAAAEGCLSFGLKQSRDEPTLFALLIEWKTEKSVELFREAAAHVPFRDLLGRHLLKADVYHFGNPPVHAVSTLDR
jgi:quinol monooxygenase YgiN